MLTVGVNAKPAPVPGEAGPSAPGAPGGDASGFAGLLTGASVPRAKLPAGTRLIDLIGGGIRLAVPKPAESEGNIPPEAPEALLGQIAAQLAHLEQAFKRVGKGAKDGDGKADAKDSETRSDEKGSEDAPQASVLTAEAALALPATAAAAPQADKPEAVLTKVGLQAGNLRPRLPVKAEDDPKPDLPALGALLQADEASLATDDAAAAPAPLLATLTGAAIETLVQPQQPAADPMSGLNAVADPAPVVDKGQLTVERHLDLVRDTQWLDRLAKDIASTAGQDGSLRFKLHPETLGALHVEVAQSQAGTTIRLTTETETARSIIADAQHRLISEARAQGVRIAEAQVGMNPNGQQNADQRRHEEARQEGFLRTAGLAEPDAEPTETSAAAAAERFA